ncbi:MAG: protein translocase subunit SecD [Pseudomonadota bacterium]
MNQYPLWKYFLVLAVVVFGIFTALPNFYGTAPAIQVTAEDKLPLPDTELSRFEQLLTRAGFEPTRQFERDGKLFYAFDSIDTQSEAFEYLREAASDDVITAKTLAPLQPAWLRSFGLEPMSLGLDLRGGVYLLFEVDIDEAIQKRMEIYAEEIESELDKTVGVSRAKLAGNTIRVDVRDPADLDKARQAVRTVDSGLQVLSGSNDTSIRVRMTDLQVLERQNFAMEQNITVLRNRVDALGVAEPVIQRQGLKRIVVQLPGIQDPAEAKVILGAAATLEFRLVDLTGNAPGSQSFPFREGGDVILKREVIASGDQIVDASATFVEGQPAVSIRLDAIGGASMLETTQKNLQKPMSVLFITSEPIKVERDGEVTYQTKYNREVINRATIQGVFSNQFNITGLTSNEARELALLLKAGALAAPLFEVGEQTIGPTTGQENVDRGFLAIQIGFLAVVIFMILYYRVFGFIANLALLTNLVLIVGVLSLLQASLTLPGIAGIVLTVGMAVDANVLIFERIREELRANVSVQAAINEGYAKAFSSIADANVTTFIAALVLFLFGTGPVKGFAVTLAIGIATSMFTAIVGTRAVVNLIYGGRKLDKLAV